MKVYKQDCSVRNIPFSVFQMKGKREFPPDVIGSGDVLSHLSKSSNETALINKAVKGISYLYVILIKNRTKV